MTYIVKVIIYRLQLISIFIKVICDDLRWWLIILKWWSDYLLLISIHFKIECDELKRITYSLKRMTYNLKVMTYVVEVITYSLIHFKVVCDDS